jgi:membrane-bound serine protease (ClpP class)
MRFMDVAIATLLIAGAALLFLEIFLPGAICGIVGLCCLVAAVILGYTRYGGQIGTVILVGVGAALIAGTVAWFKYFPDSRMGQLFVSKGTVGALGVSHDSLLHQTGVAHTNLRPSGIAVIDGKRVDVVSEGPFIAPGTPVKVVATEGMRVIVRAIS